MAEAFRTIVLDEVGSTNTEAFARARDGEKGPLWIVARRQTQGRGRSGRHWTSADGKKAYGVLTRPAGYRAGQRYPLMVLIHGGPAAADVLSFSNNAQVYAGAGYAVLRPNYRGSTNYGEAHRTAIIGNYFQKGYEDIMTGVDKLIADGLVDSTKMGAMGWSAGGHWSNWILTHTDRFKAISTGAGTMNWI